MNGRSIRINRAPALVLGIIVICIIIYFFNLLSESEPFYGVLRDTNQVNLSKLLIGTIQASQKGGLEIFEVANSRDIGEKSKGKTLEEVDEPYTQADRRSNCIMMGGLHKIFPKLDIQSEEHKEGCSERGLFELDPTVLHESAVTPDELVNVNDITAWIDPLDATRVYRETLQVRNNHGRQGQVCLRGFGEYQNRQQIAMQGIAKNFSKDVFGENSSLLIAAGSGYKVLHVGNNATAYVHITRIKKSDICAGNAILDALSGKMTTLSNENLNYSHTESPVNDKGILATLTNHEAYIAKLI